MKRIIALISMFNWYCTMRWKKQKHTFGATTQCHQPKQSSLRDWLLPMLMNGQVTVRQVHCNAVRQAEEKIKQADLGEVNIAAEPEAKNGKE